MNFRYKALPWNVIFGIGALSRFTGRIGTKLGLFPRPGPDNTQPG